VHEADTEDIADAIRSGGLANQKSQRIKRVLDWLQDQHGSLAMDWVCDENPYDILKQFTEIKGIGVKTISIVLCFNCRHDIFPVDTHVNRVASRLGLVSEKSSPDRTFKKLDPIIPDGKSLTLHLNMIRHGREVCKSRNPACGECVLLDMCEYGQRYLKGSA
jgi:endonuclease-3